MESEYEACQAQIVSPASLPSRFCLRCGGKTTTAKSRPDLFRLWTPEECWVAGLIWTDGCLSNDNGKLRVVLGLTDKETLDQVAQITGADVTGPYQATGNRQPMFSIRIGRAESVAALTAHGLVQRKSFVATWPDLPHQSHFLRGAFDGDGSVLWHQQSGNRKTDTSPLRMYSSLSGPAEFLDGAQSYLSTRGIAPKKLVKHGSIFKVQWNHGDSLKLRDVLYGQPGPMMRRKYNRFWAHDM